MQVGRVPVRLGHRVVGEVVQVGQARVRPGHRAVAVGVPVGQVPVRPDHPAEVPAGPGVLAVARGVRAAVGTAQPEVVRAQLRWGPAGRLRQRSRWGSSPPVRVDRRRRCR